MNEMSGKMEDESPEAGRRTKLSALWAHKNTKKITRWIIRVLWSALIFAAGMIVSKWYDKDQELDYLRLEINFNINELKQAVEVLDKFEQFFDTDFRMEVKTRIIDDFDEELRRFYIDSSNKDNPIWKYNRSLAESRNYVIKKFVQEGKIYAIKKNEDIKFLDGLDSTLSKINNSLVGIYTSIDELAGRSKSVGRKGKLEELKLDIDNKKKGIQAKLKQLKIEIQVVIQRLTNIRDSV